MLSLDPLSIMLGLFLGVGLLSIVLLFALWCERCAARRDRTRTLDLTHDRRRPRAVPQTPEAFAPECHGD